MTLATASRATDVPASFWGGVAHWLRMNAAAAIRTAIVGAVFSYAVNFALLQLVFPARGSFDGAGSLTASLLSSSLFFGILTTVVFGIVGYRKAVGGKQFWHDLRHVPSIVISLFRADGAAARAHLLWGAAASFVAMEVVSPWLGAATALGVLSTLPSVIGRMLSTFLMRVWTQLIGWFSPTKKQRVDNSTGLIVGMAGSAVALALGVAVVDPVVKLALALACGGLAWLLSRRTPPAGAKAILIVTFAVALGQILWDLLHPLLAMAQDVRPSPVEFGNPLSGALAGAGSSAPEPATVAQVAVDSLPPAAAAAVTAPLASAAADVAARMPPPSPPTVSSGPERAPPPYQAPPTGGPVDAPAPYEPPSLSTGSKGPSSVGASPNLDLPEPIPQPDTPTVAARPPLPPVAGGDVPDVAPLAPITGDLVNAPTAEGDDPLADLPDVPDDLPETKGTISDIGGTAADDAAQKKKTLADILASVDGPTEDVKARIRDIIMRNANFDENGVPQGDLDALRAMAQNMAAKPLGDAYLNPQGDDITLDPGDPYFDEQKKFSDDFYKSSVKSMKKDAAHVADLAGQEIDKLKSTSLQDIKDAAGEFLDNAGKSPISRKGDPQYMAQQQKEMDKAFDDLDRIGEEFVDGRKLDALGDLAKKFPGVDDLIKSTDPRIPDEKRFDLAFPAAAKMVFALDGAANAASAAKDFVLPDTTNWRNVLSNAQQNQVAEHAADVLANAKMAEANMTPIIQQATEGAGGEMIGLEHRLKGTDSLQRKIAGDMIEKEWTAEQAAAGVADAVRYTAQFSPEELAAKSQEVMAKLEAQGYQKIKVKNTWLDPDATYKGVNVQYLTPEGQQVEVQFHTPQSYWAKSEGTHAIYERMRVLPKDSSEYKALDAQQLAIAKGLKVPTGIDAIKPFKKE